MIQRLAILGVSALMATAVLAAGRVEVRAKRGASFSGYQTYAWTSHAGLLDEHPLHEGSPLDLKIKVAADRLLAGKGFARVERQASPDLLINYVGVAEDIFEAEGVTKQMAKGIKWIGDANAHSMRSYTEGTLVFEVVDTASSEMVWSGWVTEAATTAERLRVRAEKATRKVFKHFPSR